MRDSDPPEHSRGIKKSREECTAHGPLPTPVNPKKRKKRVTFWDATEKAKELEVHNRNEEQRLQQQLNDLSFSSS